MVWNLLAMSWRGWWRMKTWVIGGGIVAIVFAILFYAFTFLAKNRVISGWFGDGGAPVVMTDFLMQESIRWNTFFMFILGMTVAASIVADDLRGGAFEFYFSKPIRPRDYVAGKFLGAALVLGTIGIGAPVVLALLRVGFSGGDGEIAEALPLLPKAIAIGAYSTVVFTVIPLAISALGPRRRYSIAAWAVFYIIISNVAMGIARETGYMEIGAISPYGQVMSFTYELLEMQTFNKFRLQPPIGVAIAASVAYVVVGLGIVLWRVRRAEKSGLGGG